MKLTAKAQRIVAYLLIAASVLMLLGAACILVRLGLESFADRREAQRVLKRKLVRTSSDCGSCHAEIYHSWAASHHAHAHRATDAGADASAFEPARSFSLNGVGYRVAWSAGRPHFVEQRPGSPPQSYDADFVLGYAPLRQYVIPVGGGRYQMSEIAFDSAKRDWFNVFGGEQRQAGEWGHWRGRGMNWNSFCAQCHLTDFTKNYDPQSDTYQSKWLEHGVGCVQCHDSLSADHAHAGYETPRPLADQLRNRARSQQTCAPCHARNELLTGEPRPGMPYFDHFRITLPTDPGVFYADGQVRDEDFNWTSLLTSRMGGKAGVTCLDCHDPHSGKTLLPAANNALCLQCHGGKNPRNAPIIDPIAHSHHKPESAGNQCVACHMPTTTYMQRDPRHDHGFLRPDPLLTKELGIPNACDRCHADRGIEWQIAANERWYGAALDSRQRQRARAVSGAQKHASDAPDRLTALIASEDVPAWKATLLLLAIPWAEDPRVSAVAMAALSDSSPMVRSSAVQLAAAGTSTRENIRTALHDPVRQVRIDAEWALAAEISPESAEGRELEQYLGVSADQPIGQFRLGELLAMRGKLSEAQGPLRKAIAWDPNSPAFYETLGAVLSQYGDAYGAAAQFWRGALLDRENANPAYEAALSYSETGNLQEAEGALRETVRRDPGFDRAWYNLGLLLAKTQRAAEALAAIGHAQSIAPKVADYPYAAATIYWSMGRFDEARAQARRALEIDPNHSGARRFFPASP